MSTYADLDFESRKALFRATLKSTQAIPPWLPFGYLDLGPSPMADTAGGFIFAQTAPVGLLDRARFNDPSLTNNLDGYMPAHYIRAIDAAAKDALFMCHTYENVRDEGLLEQFFKDRSHEVPIRMILRQARKFLQRFINRDIVPALNDENRVWMVRIMADPVGEMAGTTAFCHFRRGIFGFLPAFFEAVNETWSTVYNNKTGLDISGHLRVAVQKLRLGDTRGCIFLHEVIHFVSGRHWASISKHITPYDSAYLVRQKMYVNIDDVSPSRYVTPFNLRDQKVLEEIAKHCTVHNVETLRIYGYRATRLLKELEDGATASFFNVDNYVMFVAELSRRFLHTLWMDRTSQTGRPTLDSEMFPEVDAVRAQIIEIREQPRYLPGHDNLRTVALPPIYGLNNLTFSKYQELTNSNAKPGDNIKDPIVIPD